MFYRYLSQFLLQVMNQSESTNEKMPKFELINLTLNTEVAS